jgi:mono/diheme cytochrome c family protein
MSKPRLTLIASAVLSLALAACAAPRRDEPVRESVVEDGRAIAEAQCARCHAVGSFGESPRPDAPALRVVLSRYRADVLEEEFDNGIKLGHPDMPRFQFNPQGAAALLAYLKSIQTTPAEKAAP